MTTEPTAFLFLVVDGSVIDQVSMAIESWGLDDTSPIGLVLSQSESEIIGVVNGQEMRLASEPMLGRAGPGRS